MTQMSKLMDIKFKITMRMVRALIKKVDNKKE